MANTILTKGQRQLHTGLLAVGIYLLANAAYLLLTSGALTQMRVLPGFYQWMLVSHVVLGSLLLVPMAWFIVWHLKRALAMKNKTAVWTGVLVTVASFALFVTGLFLFTKANSAENRWAFIGHRALALAAPAGYVYHRFVAHHKPLRWAVTAGIASPIALLAIFLGIHVITLPEPRPEPQAMVKRPAPGEDPWRDFFPSSYGISGAPEDSNFFPAATKNSKGVGFIPEGLLTNNDLLTADVLKQDVKEHGFSVKARIGSETCARCHADIVEQWARSAHRFASFNNPFYRASVEVLRATNDVSGGSDGKPGFDGKTRAQWCAGCHDPAIMMPGNWKKDINPDIAESQAGLTCLTCHLMDEVHGVGGNGNYRINDAAPSPYIFNQVKSGPLSEVHDLLVRSKPDVHKVDMLKPVFRTSEYCGTCHKVSLDKPVNRYRWVRGQNEYDGHQNSGLTHNNAQTWYLPPVTKTCQDCHMPLVEAPLGDVAAKAGKVRSHLFVGPNTALPAIRGDQQTLDEIAKFREGKMKVDVFAVKQGDRVFEAPDARPIAIVAGEEAELQVVVRNFGVGHVFPGGTLDSNEAWVHLVVADAAAPGQPLFESGAIDPATKRIDRDAHFYRVFFVDEQGQAALRRNPHDFRAAVHLKVIGPSTSDVVRYGLTVPKEWVGRKLLVQATLQWRKFSPDYVAFAYDQTMPGRPKPDLPVTAIAAGKATFDVVASPVAAGRVDAERVAKEWTRWNDWGVGLILGGDTRGAERAFGAIRDADPKRPDGWRNLARAKLLDGSSQEALRLLQKADEADPGNPQTAFFLGQALVQLGQLDAALERFEVAAAKFQQDRQIQTAIAGIHYRKERYSEALAAALRVLAIDPEDRGAHKMRMEIYGQMAGDAKDEKEQADLLHARDEALKAFEKFSLDESAQKWTRDFRETRPDVNFESQPIHVHPLRGVR